MTLTARVDPSLPAGTTIPNTATASSLTPDIVTGNDSATATMTTGAPSADLEHHQGRLGSHRRRRRPGDLHHPSRERRSVGCGRRDRHRRTARRARRSSTPPPAAGPAARPPGWCVHSVRCPSAARRLVTLTVAYGPDVPLGAAPNTAAVSSTTGDPTPGNNSATAPLTVTGEADLSITKTATPNPVIAGQPVTFTVTVSNSGPSARSWGGRARRPAAGVHVRVVRSEPGNVRRTGRRARSTARSARSLPVPRPRS